MGHQKTLPQHPRADHLDHAQIILPIRKLFYTSTNKMKTSEFNLRESTSSQVVLKMFLPVAKYDFFYNKKCVIYLIMFLCKRPLIEVRLGRLCDLELGN
jgi:hypothetical protein